MYSENIKFPLSVGFPLHACKNDMGRFKKSCNLLKCARPFQSLPSCIGEKLGCTQYWMDRFGSEFDPDLTEATAADGKISKCRQVSHLIIWIDSTCSVYIEFSSFKRCEHQYYNVLATSSAYPNYNVHPKRTDYCLVLVKVHR